MQRAVFIFQDGSEIEAPPVFDCKPNDYVSLGGKRYVVTGRLHVVADAGHVVTEIHIAEADVTIGLWLGDLARVDS